MPKKPTQKATPTTTRRTKAKKDPAAPKRPLSAYMFFSQDWRERVKAENPDAGFGDVYKRQLCSPCTKKVWMCFKVYLHNLRIKYSIAR